MQEFLFYNLLFKRVVYILLKKENACCVSMYNWLSLEIVIQRGNL